MHQRDGLDTRWGYIYARYLLQEQERQLQSLKEKRRERLISQADYCSCRCSLLQAISQLEALLRPKQHTRSTVGSNSGKDSGIPTMRGEGESDSGGQGERYHNGKR